MWTVTNDCLPAFNRTAYQDLSLKRSCLILMYVQLDYHFNFCYHFDFYLVYCGKFVKPLS